MSSQTNIFYIDDDADDLDFFSIACHELGENATLFNSVDKLYHQLENPPPSPSLLFLDLNMPLKNGFEIIKELRAYDRYQRLPLIVYSTASSPDIVKKARLLGASMYVVKPTALAQLRRVLQHILGIDWAKHIVSEKNFLHLA